jgi:protein-L-isoaspartate(D-aspartate) O-methyltransferase
MVLAKLIHAAEIGGGDRVLDLGCASGYSTALIARLAGQTIGLEEDERLARQANAALADCGIGNARVVMGPLVRGWPADGPYDVIVMQGAAEAAPLGLLAQLKDGGRIVCVLGRGGGAKAMLYRRVEGELSGRPVFDAAAPVLPGFAKPPEFVF